jgi:hypothetical protein
LDKKRVPQNLPAPNHSLSNIRRLIALYSSKDQTMCKRYKNNVAKGTSLLENLYRIGNFRALPPSDGLNNRAIAYKG